MFGAVLGDIIGSRYESSMNRAKPDFELFTTRNRITDDTIQTVAIMKAFLESMKNGINLNKLARYAEKYLRELAKYYSDARYNYLFQEWVEHGVFIPYYSFGNEAAVRASAAGWVAKSIDEATTFSDTVTRVTHIHPEDLKGARAVTSAVFLARTGKTKETIREHIQRNYYPLSLTVDETIKSGLTPNMTCQGSVPYALEAFLESRNFEECIRKSILLGGDTDTVAAIAGSIGEAYFGIPDELVAKAKKYIDDKLLAIIYQFDKVYLTDKTCIPPLV